MSDTWINWRFGEYHFQIGKGFSFIRWVWNAAHMPHRRPDNWKWFEAYK